MYRCENCGATMEYPQDRCPSCGVWLSGVKCENCGYMGAKDEFINNDHRCPECGSVAYISGIYDQEDQYSRTRNGAAEAATEEDIPLFGQAIIAITAFSITFIIVTIADIGADIGLIGFLIIFMIILRILVEIFEVIGRIFNFR